MEKIITFKHEDYNMFKNPQGKDKEATDFACILLMPEKDFSDFIFAGHRNFLEIAEHFNVSIAAARYRAVMLGFIKK